MKKFLSCILALAMVLSMFPSTAIVASAEEITDETSIEAPAQTTEEKSEEAAAAEISEPELTYVAKVGEQGCETLTAAIAAANAGDTITLLADITEDVTISKAVTIDGAGKTYTGKMTLKADTTIKNVNFDGNGYNGYAVETRGANYLTIEDCTAKNYGYGFVQTASGTVLTTVKNVAISDMSYGIKIDYSNSVVLENVTITDCVFGVMDSNYGEKTFTLKNCNIEAQSPLALWDRNADIVSTFTFEGNNTLTAPAGASSVIVYTGNTSLYAIVLEKEATLTATENLNVSTVADFEVKYEDGVYTSVAKSSDVVVIGTQGYASLADALAAANAGDTITLIDNVTLGEKLIIDKNITISGAKQITRASDYTGTLFEVQAGVTLTLDGGLVVDGGHAWTFKKDKPEEDMKYGGDTYLYHHVNVVDGAPVATDHMFNNYGTLLLNDVTIQNNYNSAKLSAIYCQANSVLVLDGAKIRYIANSDRGAVILAPNNNTQITMKGNTVITNNIGADNGGIVNFYGQGSVMNLEGGRVEHNYSVTSIQGNSSGTIFAAYSSGTKNTINLSGTVITDNHAEGLGTMYIHTNALFNMTGGEISNNTAYSANIYTRTASCATTVTGGKVIDNESYNNPGAPDFYAKSGTGFISGGIFTQDVSKYCVEGFEVAYENGSYSVVAKPNDVVKIGETGYATLADALAAAEAGDTITFVDDITEDVTIDKAVTIDGAGKTYTGAMTLKADTTIKNVNFDGKGYNGYAITTRGANYLTIEDCTAKNYGYGFVQLASATALTTVKNVTVSNMNYGVKVDYSGAVVLENVDITAGVAAVLNSNYGEKTITIKDSKLNILGTWTRNNTTKTNYVFEGANTIDQFITDAAIDTFKLAAGATLTAPEEITVATDVVGGNVVYENGTYSIALGLAGTGTEADPYQIGSVEDLILFRDSVNAGETKYSASGVYVVLTHDIDVAGENWVGIGSAYIDHGFMGNFDGNGFKIKNLTITNPALDSDGYAYAGLFSVTEGIDKDHQNIIKNLIIENVTISTNGHIVAAAIAYPYYTIVENVTVCGDININGGDYTSGALAYTRRCVNASNVTVSGNAGSTITGRQTVGGVISDIQMNGGLTANYSNFAVSGVKITGEKSVGGISGIISNQTLNGATVKNVELVCSDARVGAVSGSLGGTSTITNVVVENVTGADSEIGATYDHAAEVAAQIGDTYYATFAAAYAAAQAGDTITLLAPVVVAKGETLTLDKDVTITYTSNAVGEDMITVRGTLNVAAGKITYTNTDKTGNNVTVSTISCEPGSVLNVTGGVIENKTVYSTGSYAYAIDMLTNGNLGDVTATISGGTVYSDYMAIRQFNNGTACKNSLTVTGGEIYGAKRAIQVHLKNDAAYLEISGGVIEAGEGGYALCIFPETATHIAVTGGKFVGTVYTGTNGIISGGTYSEEVEAEYLAEGLALKQNADGTYGVVKAPIAKIGTVEYTSLQEAVDAANAGATITLICDAEGPGVVINKKLTIDFRNFTYTLTEGVGSTGTESNGFQILKGNTVVLRNGTLKVADSAADKFYILVQNYAADLSMSSMTLDGTNLDKWSKTDGDSYTLSNNSGNVSIGTGTKIIANNDGKLAFAFDACDKSAWGYELPVVTVNKTAVIEGNIEAAAKIDNVYYATLQQAIDAAKNGGTITLVNDIKVETADAVKTSTGLNVMFAVEGKSLTLDMNGKTIDVGYDSNELLYSVVYVGDGASLTVKGEGAINLTTGDTLAGKYDCVAYLFWKHGTTGNLTIENGTFTANKVEDSLVYTNGDKIVNVKGGTWALDNVGTEANGAPWIFNTKGNGENSILVSGGTYNFNVNAQHWAHEVDVVDANGNLSYVVDNGNGTWTVTGKTAEVGIVTSAEGGDRLVGYATFKDAVASIGKGAPETTIQLQKNITLKGQFIGHSYVQKVIIDLNGYKMSSTDKTLTVYRGGTEVTIKNGTVHGNTTGGTIQVTYGGKLILGENVTITSGGSANALKVDKDGILIIAAKTAKVQGGKNDLLVADGANVRISAGYFKYPVQAAWCAEGYVPTEKLENGFYSVEKDLSIGRAAKIGNTYYETLADAIEAANSGDTIVVVNNIEVDTSAIVTNSGGYATIYNVAKKAITIDLNGKKINVTVKAADVADCKSNMLMGVFAVDANGSLTMTGNGSVTANAVDASMTSADSHLYSLMIVYGAGGKLVVENGTYSANSVSSALVYAQYSEVVTINGGTWTLGNVGTDSNGSPWIFNAQGQNTKNVVVKGGSFNADVLHQHWIFEVEAPKELALKYDESTGMYTIVPAVAYVNEQHWSGKWYTQYIGYATLDDALEAAEGPQTRSGKTSEQEVVFLLKDVVIDAAKSNGYGATGIIIDGQILNGNGYSLTVNNANTKWDSAIYVKAGTVKNLTVKNAFRGIFTSDAAKGDIYIDNVTFDGVVYTFNSDGNNDTREGNVYVSNSVVNGWTSFSDTHKDVVFTNCQFGEGSGYAFCRPYNAASFIGCEFAAGFEMDTRGAVTFENCTIDGVALTADNLATLVTGNIDNATVK